MEHGLNLAVVVAIASGLVLWSVVAERLERWNITAPIVFVAVGLLLANGPTRLVDVRLGGAGIAELAEITLAVVLLSLIHISEPTRPY